MSSQPDRRYPNPPRVPFVRRCWLGLPDGGEVSAFTVNISAVGAYLTRDDFAPRAAGEPEAPAGELPDIGQSVTCRFHLPDAGPEIRLRGTVTWLNSRQQHPVHSLPPGFGLRFDEIAPEARARIEALVRDYRGAQPR